MYKCVLIKDQNTCNMHVVSGKVVRIGKHNIIKNYNHYVYFVGLLHKIVLLFRLVDLIDN